ncbi:hypothetical protein NLJ89_g10923 [Agrocybe chaxingu]|uniref:Uncharacterized protein n=1 Tax=Agrocybe chaxingu TaxID=84603 RepID=A0A9W8JPT7_9AGAR|nr:hypothetical protein NLJ89_g10923 [Agrocybe chaxingu]
MITQEILLSQPDHTGVYKEVAPALFFIQYSLHVNVLPHAYTELAYAAVTNPDAASWAAYPAQDGVAMYGMDYTSTYVPEGAAYDFSDVHQVLPVVAPSTLPRRTPRLPSLPYVRHVARLRGSRRVSSP